MDFLGLTEGFSQGLTLGMSSLPEQEKEIRGAMFLPKAQFSNNEGVAGIKLVCDDPANSNLLVVQAFALWVMRVNGASPEVIDLIASGMRQEAAGK